jgi:hypothetical protein
MYNQTNGLRSVNRLAHGAPWSKYILRTFACRSFIDPVTWRVRQCQSVLFFINIIHYYYYVYNLILNLIERLKWTWLSVFSAGDHIWVWNLSRFIILFYLAGLFEISVCPKDFLLWPLVGTKKVGIQSSSPLWYSIGFHLLLYFVLWFMGSQLLLAIWQLKSYSYSVWFILWGRLSDSTDRSTCL